MDRMLPSNGQQIGGACLEVKHVSIGQPLPSVIRSDHDDNSIESLPVRPDTMELWTYWS